MGAALSQVSGTFDQLVVMRDNEQDRNDVIRIAKQYAIDDAVRNGAIRDTCTILDMAEVRRVIRVN